MRALRNLLVGCSFIVLCAATLQAQAQVACKDGSKSKGGQGACSGHGGIAPAATAKAAKAEAKADTKEAKADVKAAKAEAKSDPKAARSDMKAAAKAETKAAKAETKAVKAETEEKVAAGATAECKDHSYSHAKTHQGACSSHGGVLKFLDGK